VVVGWETYLERIGPQGLRLIVAGLLDEETIVRLAGRLPEGAPAGDRARALVELVDEQPEIAAALLDALDAAAPDSDGAPEKWDESRVREDLAAALRSPDPSAARLLHRLARSGRPPLSVAEIRAAADVLASTLLGDVQGTRPKWMARAASDRAGLRELEQERRELEVRVRQLEAREARLLERSADLEQQLARRAAEVQQLRLADRDAHNERTRLERELARLEKRIEDFNERRAREGTGVITTALRRLTTEQRRAAARLEKLTRVLVDRRDAGRELPRRLQALEDIVEKLLAQRDTDARAGAAAQEAILRELAGLRPADGPERPEEAKAARRRPAPEGAAQVGLFVDVQNMFYGAREKGARLDFEALLAAAGAGRRLVRAVAYLVETRDIDQSAFIHLLQVKKYEVRRKPLRVRPDGSMKGNQDLEMALDALSTADHVDTIVLATGDGDFVPLVRQLKLRGLRVEVYGFPRSTAPDLREVADRFVPITKKLLRPIGPERRSRAGAGPAPSSSEPRPEKPAEKPAEKTRATEPAPAAT
jgi:uncharacterized LabA/DUF88 family protein